MPTQPFVWGVNAHRAYPLSMSQWLAAAHSMHLTSVRVDVYDSSTETIAWLNSLVSAAAGLGIMVLPVIVPSAAASTSEPAAYSWGLSAGAALAAAFPSLNWEAGNELDLWCSIAGRDGQSVYDYDDALYALCRGAIKGLYTGLHSASPSTMVLVGMAGIHFGFLTRLAVDGVVWDATSWHYYAAPNSAADIAVGAPGMFSKLALYGKPIVMTEFNQQDGSMNTSSSVQLETLGAIADAMKANAAQYNIVGAYIYELLDQPELVGGEAHFGLADAFGTVNAVGLGVQSYLA